MSLSDCPDCWDTPCTCKTAYLGSKNSDYEQLKKEYDALKEQLAQEKAGYSLVYQAKESLRKDVERLERSLAHARKWVHHNELEEMDRLERGETPFRSGQFDTADHD